MRTSVLTEQTLEQNERERSDSRRRQIGGMLAGKAGKPYFWPLLTTLNALILVIGIALGRFITLRQMRGTEAVVVVNGHIITKANFYSHLEAGAGDATLHRLVGNELQVQFARSRGLAPTEAEIEARYALESKQADFDRKLEQSHQTPAMYRESLRAQMAQTALLTRGVQVTEDEVRQYYAAESNPKNPVARYYHPETIQIKVIVTAQGATAKQAQQALRDGRPFADVAQSYSQDASRTNGGVLRPFQRGRTAATRISGLEPAIFALKIGEELGPRKFGGAWWIIQCVDKAKEQTVPYERVREECRQGALLAHGMRQNGKALAAEFQEFQRKAVIQAFWTRYQDAVSVK